MEGHFGEDFNSDYYKECYEALPSRSSTYMSELYGQPQEPDPYYSTENIYPEHSNEVDGSQYNALNGYE
jgi:hypothetical protein